MSDNINELFGPKVTKPVPTGGTGKAAGLTPVNVNPNFSHWPFVPAGPVKNHLPDKSGLKPAP